MPLPAPAHLPDLPFAVWDDERAVWVVGGTSAYTIDVMPLLFTAALVTTPRGQDRYYTDRWCYTTVEKAALAGHAWDPAVDKEPSGWHRHPASGRRRPDGDPAQEHVQH